VTKVLQIAARDFLATVATKGFILGLLVMPAVIALMVSLGPRLFNPRDFQLVGEVAVVDPTGVVLPRIRTEFDPASLATRLANEAQQGLAAAPEGVQRLAASVGDAALESALGVVPDIAIIERPPDTDIERDKAWLYATGPGDDGPRHLGLVVIHDDAVARSPGEADYGTYDLYVPPGLDERAIPAIHSNVREAIVGARVSAQALDRDALESIIRVRRPLSVTVSEDTEGRTVDGFNTMLPMAFGMLLFIGIMTGGQAMLTSTVEEKSSRVIEVLLSAVSPMQLMTGKLLGHMAVSILAMGLYIAMGLMLLASFSLFGLLDPWLIFYLVLFFVIAFLVVGSLMMAVGAAVNEMSEAQSLQTPIILVLMVPWLLWLPISRDPNSTLAVVVSFVPPINTFGMLLRMASTAPPSLWQVWLSIAVGVVSVFGALWVAAKVFRIGLLMYGKPPNFATLARWIRAA
jgi:ABC-2 type transport system permease protein